MVVYIPRSRLVATPVKTKGKLTVTLATTEPVCAVNNRQEVTHVATSAVCRYDSPIAPPVPIPSTSELSITVLTSSHILGGMPIYITPIGTMDKAQADSIPCIGVALEDAFNGEPGNYISEGHITRHSWFAITGSADLIPGRTYYLAGTGMLTYIQPTSGLLQQIGVAVSRSLFDVDIRQAIRLA